MIPAVSPENEYIECPNCQDKAEKTKQVQNPDTLEIYSATYRCGNCGKEFKVEL